MLNKLCERWQATNLWNEICKKKVIICEPKFSDEFEEAISHFYNVIETTTENSGQVDGALFIAVCRGKVSEGLDFADNNARAVICLGMVSHKMSLLTRGLSFPSLWSHISVVAPKQKIQTNFFSKKVCFWGELKFVNS